MSLDGGERTGTLFAAVLDGSVDVNVETLDGALDRGVLAGTLLLLEINQSSSLLTENVNSRKNVVDSEKIRVPDGIVRCYRLIYFSRISE